MSNEKRVLTDKEKEEMEKFWERAADKFWKTLERWKKHNPKKYRKFWRDFRKLEKEFGF